MNPVQGKPCMAFIKDVAFDRWWVLMEVNVLMEKYFDFSGFVICMVIPVNGCQQPHLGISTSNFMNYIIIDVILLCVWYKVFYLLFLSSFSTCATTGLVAKSRSFCQRLQSSTGERFEYNITSSAWRSTLLITPVGRSLMSEQFLVGHLIQHFLNYFAYQLTLLVVIYQKEN